MLRVLSVFLVFLAGSAAAQTPQFLSTDGGLFDYTQNEHGVVLTVIEQNDSLLVTPDTAKPVTKVGDIVYLGRGCEAYNRKFGNGRWRATGGGFLVSFRRAEIAFPGQRIDVGQGVDCAQ